MTTNDLLYLGLISMCAFTGMFVFVMYGGEALRRALRKQERRLDLVLNHQLLMNIPAKLAMGMIAMAVILAGLIMAILGGSSMWFFIGAMAALALPYVALSHLEEKRRKKLNEQIVDGITSLASGVRAGLNLVQSFQLLVRNSSGPIKQEFAQLMREYELGIDLSAAMRNTSDRIGSSYYRLLLTAIAAHRDRGGDMGQSLDRIADSIREIQRLEGRLEALTAEGRSQARFMAAMPFVIIGILWYIVPEDTSMLLTDPTGRLILLLALGLIAVGFFWIRRIMQVDI